MRVLQVITSLQTGGAEKLITEIVPMLRKKGHDVDVALFDGRDTQFKKELATCGCKIYSLSAGGSVYNPLLIFKLRKIVKAYDEYEAKELANKQSREAIRTDKEQTKGLGRKRRK